MTFTRVVVVAAIVLSAVVAAAEQTPQGTYQSSLDSRMYDLRVRGENGLDIYADGQIIAVTDRKKRGDSYKGKTRVLAPTCPEPEGGEIEIVEIGPERIRARVEHALKDRHGRLSCSFMVVIGQSKWTDFSLIRAEGSGNGTAAAEIGRVTGSNAGGESGSAIDMSSAMAASLGGITFTYVGSSVEGAMLTVRLKANNHGNDQPLEPARYNNLPHVSIVTDTGETRQAETLLIGNVTRSAQLVNGVPVTISIGFSDLPTRGGQVLLSSIAKLTIELHRPKGRVEMRHLPLRFPSGEPPDSQSEASEAVAAAASSSPHATSVDRGTSPDAPTVDRDAGGIEFQVAGATTQGNALLVTIIATNEKNDRAIRVADRYSAEDTTVIDEAGNTYKADSAVIGNQTAGAELLSGVPTKIVVRFPNMATARGVLIAREIKRLRLSVAIQEGSSWKTTQVEFRNIPITK